MIWKFLLTVVLSELWLCGLCGVASNPDTPSLDYEKIFDEANRACGALDSASDNIRISNNFANDINLLIEIFNKLEIGPNSFRYNFVEKDIQYLVEYLQNIANFQPTWEKGVELIRDMTLLIYENEDPTVCPDLVLEVEKWRREIYRIQKVIQGAQSSHQQFIDCLQDAESDSCHYSMALPIVLAAKHDEQTTEARREQIADFREKYTKYQKEYHGFQPLSNEWNLRILWLRSFKLSNYRFNYKITKQLDKRSEAVATAFVDTVASVKRMFHKIEKIVEDVNGGIGRFEVLFDLRAIITYRLRELKNHNRFLKKSFDVIRPLCDEIKRSLPNEFVTTSGKLSEEQLRQTSFPSSLDQHFFLSDDLSGLVEIYDLASIRNEDLKTALTDIQKHLRNGTPSMLIRKQIFEFYAEINNSIISYSKCSKLGLFGGYSLTAIQSDRYLRNEDYNESYNVITTHAALNFMDLTKDFLEKQLSDLTEYKVYVKELEASSYAVDPSLRRMSPNDVVKFYNFWSKTTETVKDLFDTQCMTNTSMFIGALIKQLSLESSFSFDDFFETDPKVQEALNSQSDYSSIQDIVDDILDNTRDSWDSVESIYTDIVTVFNNAYTFVSTNYDSSHSTTIENLVQQATTQSTEISEIKSKSEESSALPTHLGPIALKIFSLHFPESPA